MIGPELSLLQLAGAILDVQREEPLPANSPLWETKHLRIFPHFASETPAITVLPQVVENRLAILEGTPLKPGTLIDLTLGY